MGVTIGTVALAVSLLVGVAMILVTLITCFLLFRTKKDLRVLRRKFDYAIATGKKGSEVNTPQDNKEFDLVCLAELGSANQAREEGGRNNNGGDKQNVHSPPVSAATTTALPNTTASPPTTIEAPPMTTATPPIAVKAPPTTSKPVQIEPTSTSGYAAVNMLSILPDDLRTEENLEGGSLPDDQAQKMIADYNKQRQEYEERELKKQSTAAATGSSPSKVILNSSHKKLPVSSGGVVGAMDFAPGYEDVEVLSDPGYDRVVLLASKSAPASRKADKTKEGEYEDPADAIHASKAGNSQLRGTKSNVVVPKSQVSPNQPKTFQLSTSYVDNKYTAVYNPGDGEIVGQPDSTKQAMSDTSHNHRILSGSHSSPGKQLHGRCQNTVGVSEGENSSGGSMDDMSKDFDRKEPFRCSKHKSAKEEVEFDPTAKKLFRVTSTKKKRAANGRDVPDGGREGGEESNGDSSPDHDSKTQTKEKLFDLYGEFGGEEYSMVNMADKKRYRTEDDVMKKEGSGVPQRYSAKTTNN